MPIKVRATHWHGVAIWKWKVKEEDCGICRQPFDGTCPKCKMPGDECPPVWGNCNHHFHMHCIMKWLQQQRAQDRCPLCRQPWEIKICDNNEPSDVDMAASNNNNISADSDDLSRNVPVRRALQLD